MSQLSRRRWWLCVHRWLGLTLGAVLLVCALTGVLLVAAKPLDRALHAQLFTVPGSGAGAVTPLLQSLRAEFGPEAALRLRAPRQPGESVQVRVDGLWRGTVYLDAATGRELGRRARDEGFFNQLFELHSSLFARDSGRAVLALAALAYVAMLLTGGVLWWPARWRHAWSVKTGSGLTRALFDLHRVAGALLGLLVLVAVLTGVYMAWKPLSGWVTALANQETLRPPKVAPAPDSAGVLPDLEAALARAHALFPGSEVGVVHIPAGRAPLRVRLRLPDDPHPNGQTSVWLHPQTGEVLGAQAWSRLDAGTKAYSFVYPLHTGELGGMATLVATTVAGLALSGYGVSGLWLWWRRRRSLR